LSFISSPFGSGYFGDGLLVFAQMDLNSDPPVFWSFLPWLGWQVCVTMPSFFPLRWNIANFYSQAGLEPPYSSS
jgi:hypothetical protein